MKFVKCNKCGKIVMVMNDSACSTVCCGEDMTELKAGTTDGAYEKHIPAVTVNGNQVSVNVGSVDHPMMDNHYIQWIVLETTSGCQVKHLKPEVKPHADFVLTEGESYVAAYEYCNLHGLWKAEA